MRRAFTEQIIPGTPNATLPSETPRADHPALVRQRSEPALLRSLGRARRRLGRADSYLDFDLALLQDDSDDDTGDDDRGAPDSAVDREDRGSIAWAAVAVVCAMLVSVVPFELLNKMDRGCSGLIFFGQIVYAALECLCSGGVRRFLLDRKIPMGYHLCGLAFERGRTALYNGALDMGLPMPVYLVIKNSGLVVSMALGWAVQRKSYSCRQVAGVLVITAGVIASTLSARPASSDESLRSLDGGAFMFAAALMAGGTVATSTMNVVQERSFAIYGKYFQETMFYTNVLMLPVLLVDSEGILSHARTWAGRWDPLPLPAPFDLRVPTLWLMLLVNIVSQSAMKVSCMKLTAMGGQVSNVVVVTVARFLSLVVSAVGLNGPPMPRPAFWAGGVLVLAGTLAYVLAGAPAAPPQKKGQ